MGSAIDTPPEGGRLAGLANLSKSGSTLLDFLTRLLVVLVAVALIAIGASELFRKEVVIEPLAVPKPLTDLGFSSEVAATRLMDAIRALQSETTTSKQHLGARPEADTADVVVPGVGISLKSAVRYLRAVLSLPETRVSGEFVCAETGCPSDSLILRLRVTDRKTQVVTLPTLNSDGLDSYFDSAARAILLRTDPYVVAKHIYLDEPDTAHAIALRVIREKPEERKWALNLIGLIHAERGDMKAAIGSYTEAIEIEDDFVPALVNWGNALRDIGRRDRAVEMYQAAIKAKPEDPHAHANWAFLSLSQGEIDDAIDRYRRAIEHDPDQAALYVNLGIALKHAGTLREADDAFRIAASLDGATAAAYEEWGASLLLQANAAGEPAKKLAKLADSAEKLDAAITAHATAGTQVSERLSTLSGLVRASLRKSAPEAVEELETAMPPESSSAPGTSLQQLLRTGSGAVGGARVQP